MRTILIILGILTTTVSLTAAPMHIRMDLTNHITTEFELEISLINDNAVDGESYIIFDNFVYGDQNENFESGSLGNFFDLNTPGTISLENGSINHHGNFVMQMSEDPTFDTSIVFSDYTKENNAILSFDLNYFFDDKANDQLVFKLLNPYNLDPLINGINGNGEVLIIDNNITTSVTGFTYTCPIPEPTSIAIIFLGGTKLLANRKRLNQNI